MAQIQLYRGGQGASLPDTLEDGAIYIIATGDNTGELYADIENQRIKIGSGSSYINIQTTAEWNAESPKTLSASGMIYVYSDARSYIETYTENGEELTRTVYVPGIKIGDGSSYVVDLPFVNVTASQINFWNHKIDCYLDDNNTENLVLTRDVVND